MEKRCLFFTALGTLVILTAAILFFIIYTGVETICTTKKCVQTANELMTSLDQSVEPCDDFFEFACGNVRKLLQGHRHDAYFSSDDEPNDEDYLRKSKTSSIRRMIEEPPNPYDTNTLSKIKSFYRSCTRMPKGNETFGGITATGIRAVLRDIGGWPIQERGNWREDRFDWVNAVHHLRKIGYDKTIFIETTVEVNQFDPTKYILMIRMAKDYFGGARINTEGDKKLFVEYMVEVAAYFGVDRIRAERDSFEIMEFFQQLKKIENTNNINKRSQYLYQNVSDDKDNYSPRSITQLQHDIPGVQWKSYLNGIVGPSIQLAMEEFVNAENVEELRRFIDLVNRTPKKILANYLCWRVIQTYIEHLPEATLHEKLRAKFANFYHGGRNRPEICTRLIRNKLPEMVEACYVRKYVTDDVKRITKDIIESIKSELVKIVDSLDWLDADIKQVSKEKLATVRDYVAYTPEMPTPSTMTTHPSSADVYERIEFDEKQFMINLMMIQSTNANVEYQKLRQAVVQQAYDHIEYSVIKNTLVLPSDYLQAFYVDETRPVYINFGILGTLIAYQLSNVFLEGKRYDVYGALREWSTSQSLFNYDNKTKCLTEQYERFEIPEIGRNVNASETQQDDVAIMFGKLIAYKAFEAWLETHQSEGRLPGMQYSMKQLFWIATAMDDCYRQSSPTPLESTKTFEMKVPKSISKLRVVGPLRNSEDFANDFRCTIDSYMNPGDKCTLW